MSFLVLETLNDNLIHSYADAMRRWL